MLRHSSASILSLSKRLIMTSNVVKKDETKEPFDAEKIKKSIALAAEQAGLTKERENIEQVATTVLALAADKEEIATSEIKEKILIIGE